MAHLWMIFPLKPAFIRDFSMAMLNNQMVSIIMGKNDVFIPYIIITIHLYSEWDSRGCIVIVPPLSI
jgi:hypothetical protein